MRAKILIAKQLLIIINWVLKVLFTEEEIETLESHFWRNRKYVEVLPREGKQE